jgi:hypothetical protein
VAGRALRRPRFGQFLAERVAGAIAYGDPVGLRRRVLAVQLHHLGDRSVELDVGSFGEILEQVLHDYVRGDVETSEDTKGAHSKKAS